MEEKELETTDNDDDEDLILCRYSVAESRSVRYSGHRLRLHSCVRFMDRITLPRGTGISYWYT